MAGTPPIWDADSKRFLFNDGQGNWYDSTGASVPAPPGRMPFAHAGRHRPGGVDDIGLAAIAMSGSYADLTNATVMGTAVVDFGATPSTASTVSVSGQTAIQSGSQIELWFMASTTADNDSTQHQMASVMTSLVAGAIIVDSGFTIYATSTGGLMTGQFLVQWKWK